MPKLHKLPPMTRKLVLNKARAELIAAQKQRAEMLAAKFA